jgi:hypothetical protein
LGREPALAASRLPQSTLKTAVCLLRSGEIIAKAAQFGPKPFKFGVVAV